MSDQNKEMPNRIIRVVHNRENPFVQLNKNAIWDMNLSLKAVGLWVRCMSRPDNWKFSIKELVGKCKEGRRAVDSAMQELIENGYVCRLEYFERNEDGKFKKGMGGVEYVFFEFKATEEEKQEQLEIFKKSFRHCGFGDRRNGDSRNAHLLIKKETKKEEETDILTDTNVSVSPERSEERPVTKQIKRITFNQGHFEGIDAEMHRKWCEAFGTLNVAEEIKRMEVWLDANPSKRPKKNCLAFITRWLGKSHNQKCLQDAFRGSQGANRKPDIDRRTKDKNGNPVQIEGLF